MPGAVDTVVRSREMSILLVLVVVRGRHRLHAELPLQQQRLARPSVTPSILLLLAAGQAVVIITRNVDLSVGSMLAITAYLTGRLFIDNPGIPIMVVVLAGMVAGRRLLGLVNGLLVAFGQVPPW